MIARELRSLATMHGQLLVCLKTGFAGKQRGTSERFLHNFFRAVETFLDTMQLHSLFILLTVSAGEKYRSPEAGTLSAVKTLALRNLQNCSCPDAYSAVRRSTQKYRPSSIERAFIPERPIGEVLFVLTLSAHHGLRCASLRRRFLRSSGELWWRRLCCFLTMLPAWYK